MALCDAHIAHAVRTTPAVLVYRQGTRYYGCARPKGASRLVASYEPDDELYGSDLTLDALYVKGDWVVALQTTGGQSAAQCSKAMVDDCPGTSTTANLTDVRDGTRCSVTTGLVEPVMAQPLRCPISVPAITTAPPVATVPASAITTSTIPGGGPQAMVKGADGALWMALGDDLARLDLTTGSVTTAVHNAGTVTALVSAPGAIWYAASGQVRRFDLASHKITRFATTAANGLAAGADGRIWATLDRGGVARIDPSRGAVRRFKGPRALGLTPGPGTDTLTLALADPAHAIGRLDTRSGRVRRVATTLTRGLDRADLAIAGTRTFFLGDGVPLRIDQAGFTALLNGRPAISQLVGGIATAADGNVYVADAGAGAIGRITPSTGAISEYALPSGLTPDDLIADAGLLWFATARGTVSRVALSDLS